MKRESIGTEFAIGPRRCYSPRHRALAPMKNCRVVIAAVLWAATCVAQSSSPGDAGNLQFGAVVTDASGTAIHDVTTKDLTIEIQKKTQPGQVQPISPVTAIVDPAPGEFTNRSNAVTGRGLVMLVIDTIHTRWLDERDLRPEITKYLASCATHNLPVSLLVMDPHGTLHTVHDYTTSSPTLTAALNRADAVLHGRPPGDATPEVVAETARLVDFLKGTIANYTAASVPLRASPEPVLDMFRTLAASTAGISGRKALVWIANITPFEVEEKTGLVIGTTMMVNNYGVIGMGNGGVSGHDFQNHQMLTPDELKVLRPFWKSCLTALLRTEVALYPLAIRGQTNTPVDPQTLHAMHVLAAMTGGREVSPTEPLASLTGISEQNLAAYHVVAPDVGKACKSDWCDLKVAVNRPGVRVLAPNGFFREATAWRQADVLSAVLSSPLDFNGVPFILRWTTTEAAAPKKKLGFVVTFPPEADLPPPTGHELNLQIFVHATKLGSNDEQNANFNAAGHLSPDQARQAHQQGFALNNVIELAPGDYTVKFLVHDKLTGRLGSITVPLKVS
jgi:VWFA-related protein